MCPKLGSQASGVGEQSTGDSIGPRLGGREAGPRGWIAPDFRAVRIAGRRE